MNVLLRFRVVLWLMAVSLAACDGAGGGDGTNTIDPGGALPRVDAENCSVDVSGFISGGVPPDGIPALVNPETVAPGEVGGFLTDDSRVIGFFVDDQPYAVPHNILWWHEIANFDLGDRRLAVTYCPLTGSSMAFDRRVAGGATFGVSGLLFRNNLTMYDRATNASLWPQMSRQAGCGPKTGTALPMTPVIEMTWGRWRTLFPDTRVVSSNTGFNRNYTPTGYPYGNYEDPDNPSLLDGRRPADRTRPPKERGLGIPDGAGGIVFPFGLLDDTDTPVRAVHETAAGRDIVVFWDRAGQGAMAYERTLDGQRLTFTVANDRIVDAETGSTWRIDGRAVAGPLAGRRLTPVAEAYVAFWFAWVAFHPEIRLWDGA